MLIYPVNGPADGQLKVRLRLYAQRTDPTGMISTCPYALQTWQLPVPRGGSASLEMTSDFTAWLPLLSITNRGGIVEWHHFGARSDPSHFRIVPR
jgi:hypothetical protein